MRVKAIGALGWASFQEAIPALCAIAKDEKEDVLLRRYALCPGLCYTKNAQAEATAISLSTHREVFIRIYAYYVLSHQGTDKAVEVLASRLQADKPLIHELISALSRSKHERAGRMVFDLVDFSTVRRDENVLQAYAAAMDRHRIPEAEEHMLALATQQPTRSREALHALRYFASFPREEVVPGLIAAIDARTGGGEELYEPVMAFINSPKISAESKKKLSACIESGKVTEPYEW
ncbi:MAG TPA: hypothetical protein VF614_07270 [Chthoniobacteraceae bacterium]